MASGPLSNELKTSTVWPNKFKIKTTNQQTNYLICIETTSAVSSPSQAAKLLDCVADHQQGRGGIHACLTEEYTEICQVKKSLCPRKRLRLKNQREVMLSYLLSEISPMICLRGWQCSQEEYIHQAPPWTPLQDVQNSNSSQRVHGYKKPVFSFSLLETSGTSFSS